MSKYKVMLTVKDRYGSIKKLPAGCIEVDNKLSDEDLAKLDIPVYVPDVKQDILKYTLTHGETAEQLEFDIDRSNEWNETDSTSNSNYIWESMTDAVD